MTYHNKFHIIHNTATKALSPTMSPPISLCMPTFAKQTDLHKFKTFVNNKKKFNYWSKNNYCQHEGSKWAISYP